MQTEALAGDSSHKDSVTATISEERRNAEATSDTNNNPVIATTVLAGDGNPVSVTASKHICSIKSPVCHNKY